MDIFSQFLTIFILIFVQNVHPLSVRLAESESFGVFSIKQTTAYTLQRSIPYISILSLRVIFLYSRPHAVFHFFQHSAVHYRSKSFN